MLTIWFLLTFLAGAAVGMVYHMRLIAWAKATEQKIKDELQAEYAKLTKKG